MKKHVSILLMFILLVSCLFPAGVFAATSDEKENAFNAAFKALEDYLENPGVPGRSLDACIEAFEKLGNYNMSNSFVAYASALRQIEEDNVDAMTEKKLRMISSEKFMELIEESSLLCSPEELISYKNARQAEKKGNISEALAWYEKCNSFYDSLTRYDRLAEKYLEETYQKGTALFNSGALASAYYILKDCKGYKKADTIMDMIVDDLGYEPKSLTDAGLYGVARGDIVTFGMYEQDNSKNNGKEPVEWIVLDVDMEKGAVLLLSKRGLATQRYYTNDTNMTWEKSVIRSWLNRQFYIDCFSSAEQARIQMTTVDNSKEQGYSKWKINGSSETQDNIFLLSYAEANKYLGVTKENNNNTDSRVSPTASAKAAGAYSNKNFKTGDGSEAGWWWLRSPGHNQHSAAFISTNGALDDTTVNHDLGSVRPSMWVSIN